jgi:signal transduction histidine kinase
MAERRPSSKAVIVVTLAVVVASFVSGSIYGEVRESRTRALTAEIAGNESPSIMHLAGARAELRGLRRALSNYVLRASTGQKTDPAPVERARERLRANIEAYFAIPSLPGEGELWRRIEKELTDVEVLAGQIVDETRAGRYAVAQKLLFEELPDATDEEADAIIAGIQLNAARVQERAGEIEGERRRRLLWIFGLDALSAALAVALAVFALRTVSSKEAIMRRRSEELEGFAGRVAHDLLNPLSAVELSLAAAARAEGPRREATLARATRSLGRARHLVDDLLAFAQAGARPSAGAVAPVNDVVTGVLDEMRTLAQQNEVTIEADLPGAATAVRCAPGVLSSLLANLVGNALKHMGDSPRRLVRVAIFTPPDRVRFEVTDTGPGLPPELLPVAFDPYVRGSGSRAPGLGLGLATVRRLVEGHDGRYGVRSQLGAGSTFWFELPAAPDLGGPANDVHLSVGPSMGSPGHPSPTSHHH